MLKQVDGAGVAQRVRTPVRRFDAGTLKLAHDLATALLRGNGRTGAQSVKKIGAEAL